MEAGGDANIVLVDSLSVESAGRKMIAIKQEFLYLEILPLNTMAMITL